MQKIVFYSWQSDLPNTENRGFIQKALENACKTIASNADIEVEPVMDRDTQGVAGAPDIASTIFAKITAADIFVADISLIGQTSNGRFTPNPNVLIELGYALKTLGFERVVLVFNIAHGEIENLPFDLRMRRLVTYNVSSKTADKSKERKALESNFVSALLPALELVPEQDSAESIPALDAIERNAPNKLLALRRNLEDLLARLMTIQPKMYRDGGDATDLIAGIEQSQEIVAEFSKIAEIATAMRDEDSVLEIYRWFAKLLEKYHPGPEGGSGRTSDADGDFYKFVGNEMFVTLIAFLLKEEQWDIIRRIFEEPLTITNDKYNQGPSLRSWSDLRDHSPLLEKESRERQRKSLHADFLKERHTNGGLAAIMPFSDYTSADLFLSLQGANPENENMFPRFWYPISVLFIDRTPLFIKKAERKQYAKDLMDTLSIPNAEALKGRIGELGKSNVFDLFFRGFSTEDIENIATK